MSTQCPTRSGPHQCDKREGHDGPCEAQAREYVASFHAPCLKCGVKISAHRTDGPRLVCPT